MEKIIRFLKDRFFKPCKAEDIQCPVCGYYCLGKGGYWCIDKPYLVEIEGDG